MLLVAVVGGAFVVFAARRRRGSDAVAPGGLALAAADTGSEAPDPPAVVPAAAASPAVRRAVKPAPVAAAAVPVVPAAPAISPLLAAKPKPEPKQAADKKKKGTDRKAAAAKAAERFQIGYRGVRVGDGPDDLRSRELGRLDRGDEVEILGSHEGFLQVRTPTGLTGWIPRHTITGSPIGGA